MGLYSKYILPKVIHNICGLKPTMIQRSKIVPEASGNVLEIGIGSGLNMAYYDPDKVNYLVGIDPYPYSRGLDKSIEKSKIQFEFINESAEQLSMENTTFDTVVSTYTFCTIAQLDKSLSEIKRVLKPSGKLIFIEHGKAPDEKVQRTQNRINPIWKKIGGGCNLNRDIPKILEKNGFKINDLQSMYIPGWKPATFNFWGIGTTRY
ncbi:MAG: class I SAM-dependent methyltransferase [Saprospiraceae bacterium]